MCGSTDLPMRRNSPTSPCRLMAIRMLRTVMPSQKHTTTRALGRWALSRSSSRSKLCSPALLQILPGKMYNVQVNWPVKVTYNSSHNLLWKCHMFTRKFYTIACTQIKYIQLWYTIVYHLFILSYQSEQYRCPPCLPYPWMLPCHFHHSYLGKKIKDIH